MILVKSFPTKNLCYPIISDKSEVGYYEQAQKVVKILMTIITSLGTVMMPRIANTFASGNKEKVKEYMKKSFRMVFFLGFPLIFGLISVSDAFVPFFFGSGYEKTGTIMKVISPIILFIGLSSVTGTQYLLPTKRQKEYTLSVVFGACVNFVMNSLLIGRYGAIGASIGTVIAEFTVTSVQIYYTRNDFSFKKIIALTKKYLFASIIMFICCKITGHFITNNVLSIIAQVVIGAGVYGVILLILKDDFLNEIIGKFKGKLSKENK